MNQKNKKVILFANTDWYLFNFRRSLALALKARGYDVLLISPDGEYGKKLRSLGLRWQAVPMERSSLNFVREAYLLWYLYRLFCRERPALVHSFTIKCVVYGSLVARLANIRARVNAVAGMGYVFTSKRALALLLRPFVKLAMRMSLGGAGARLILQNPDDVGLFRQSGIVPDRQIRLIKGSGVDCSRFKDQSARTLSNEPFRVVLAARLLWDKGIAEYIEAAYSLRGEGRGISFLLAGQPDEGNPSAVSSAYLQKWVNDKVVDWLGQVDDMPALFASVDVVVLPSYREGLPKTLIEAAACALPLITTDVPGCREVVSHEINGLLVPVRNADALAKAIARLQDDPVLAGKLGQMARHKALTEFDENIVNRMTIDVYEELL